MFLSDLLSAQNRNWAPTRIIRVSQFLTVVLVIAALARCSPQPVADPDLAQKIESAVIVVPGYYGTRLVRETDGSLIFISVTQALFGDQPLTLPVPGLGFEGTVNLQPENILDEVRIIPLFYSIDVYGSLLNQLRSTSKENREVIPFTYDWRGDLIEGVRKLDDLIHQLKERGKKNISIVAHSMGGLIVSYYLRYGTQDIDSAVETWKGTESLENVVMAGVPFLGVMNSFRNMNFGVTVGLNASLLSAEAYASFPASYYTLPISDSDELLTQEWHPLKGIIRSPEHWRQDQWGLLMNREIFSNEILKRRSAYTSFWLSRSQRFLDLIRAPLTIPSPNKLSLLYCYAKGTPTLARGVWVRNQAKGPDSLLFENPGSGEPHPTIDLYADGDGTVTVPSAQLPPAFRQTFQTTIQEYEIGHTELVTYPKIQQDIVTFLENREQKSSE